MAVGFRLDLNNNYDDLGLYRNRLTHAETGLQPRFVKRRVEAADPAFLNRDVVHFAHPETR